MGAQEIRHSIPGVLSGIITLLVSIAVITVALTVMSIPLIFSACIASVISIYAYYNDRFAPILIAFSLVLSLIVLQLLVSLFFRSGSDATTFRPDEQLMIPGGRLHFKKNMAIENFAIPFGDLYAISGHAYPQIRHPRVVSYYTDALGYRNTRDLSFARYAILGDSYVVGSTVDQKEIISERLSAHLGEGVYNAGFPTHIPGYINRFHQLFLDKAKDGTRFILVLFEGNDFACPGDQFDNFVPVNSPTHYVPPFIRKLELYRLFFGLSRQALNSMRIDNLDSSLLVKSVGGRPMAFYRPYVWQVRRKQICSLATEISQGLRAIGPYFDLVAFAPTKYRIYYDHIRRSDDALPNHQSRRAKEIAEIMGAKFIDLTPYVYDAARRHLEQNKFVYWRDDTHWNGLAIDAAARAIAAALLGKKEPLGNAERHAR